MNTKSRTCVYAAAVLVGLAILVYGCASPNPTYNASQPVSASNPAYIPNTNVTTGIGVAQGVNAVTAPLNPYSPLVDIGLTTGLAVAAWFAKRKNDQLAASTAVTNQLAASVVAQGPTVAQAVLDHASSNEAVYPAVADVVNKKTVA